MDRKRQEIDCFLEKQLEWCKKQDLILQEIELKLYEMKEIAEYARDFEKNAKELKTLNIRINELKKEVHALESQLSSDVH